MEEPKVASKVIKQTGNTIIFDEFNSEKKGLDDMLKDAIDKDLTAGEFVKLLMEGENGKGSALLVRNFQEFLDKFAPKVYEIMYVDENNHFAGIEYTTEKPEDERRIHASCLLTDSKVYKAIKKIMESKGPSGKNNLDFDYNDTLESLLSPRSVVREYKKLRKRLGDAWNEFLTLNSSGTPSAALQQSKQNVKAKLDAMTSEFEGKSPLAFLPILIEDRNELIKQIEGGTPDGNNEKQQSLPGMLSFDTNGKLTFESLPEHVEQSDKQALGNEHGSEKGEDQMSLVKVIDSTYRKHAPLSIKDKPALLEYTSSLVCKTFGDIKVQNDKLMEIQKIDNPQEKSRQLSALVETYKQDVVDYQRVYKEGTERFAKEITAIIQKFLGVKNFFDNATTKDGELANGVSVLIANCRVSDILDDDGLRETFGDIFNRLADERGSNKFWFAVMPGIDYGSATSMKKLDDKPVDSAEDLISSFESVQSNHDVDKKKEHPNYVSMDDFKRMLELLGHARITTFFNFTASEDTGFEKFSIKRLNEYKSLLEDIDNQYAVFAYPNFTILPQKSKYVTLGISYDQDNNPVEEVAVLSDVYLDASYVAAGMIVGSQNHRLLEEKGFLVDRTVPCVRFDISEQKYRNRFESNINRERYVNMGFETKEILKDTFGFVFSGEDVQNGKNCFVLCAKTLGMQGRQYMSIYQSLVLEVARLLIRSLDVQINTEAAEIFKKHYVTPWEDSVPTEKEEKDNSILKHGESIDATPDRDKLKVTAKFGAEAVNMDIEMAAINKISGGGNN